MRSWGFLIGAAIQVCALGCGGSEGDCEDLCAMEAECQQRLGGQDSGAIPIDQDTCRSTCNSLVEDDPAYADGVANRVSCLEEQLDQGFCGSCSFDGT
ncbi:MAG: hypothetical protein HOV80_08885 [Polyangiaceae bacterium]|nr:hypothetical protein [Polyangiaceae bacterium]